MLQDLYSKAEKLLSSSLNDWGLTLATSDTLDPAWAQILSDPFLRRILLRYLSSSHTFLFLIFEGFKFPDMHKKVKIKSMNPENLDWNSSTAFKILS